MSVTPFQRLSVAVAPKHYNLELQPDLIGFTFAGNVSIKIQIVSPVDEIVLNAKELEIVKSELIQNCQSFETESVALNKEQETATLKFNKLFSGDATLNIKFNGELNDKMRGFYRSKYLAETGEIRYSAVTQFQPTDARRCFPFQKSNGWDEPAIKATFNITLKVPAGRKALSNMPIVSDINFDGLRMVRFDTTPIMSTYLVAVVVGEYDYVEDKSSDGVLVRVYTPLHKKAHAFFALESAKKVLPFYKEYFNIAYPLPKIDLIAIADFSSGGMENWGIITATESHLLIDPRKLSVTRKQTVALTVAHEIAHQWFGNLVTMEWWTHLWLNEAYATFLGFMCVDQFFPEYDIWTMFVTRMYAKALDLDALENSHPIEVDVGHPSEIDEIFDDISYNKGASVIRMLHHHFGDKGFRKAMNIYLTRHQYKNTVAEDLWAALEEATSKPVGAVMTSWIKKKGFPVVSASCVQNGNKRVLMLTQDKLTTKAKHPSEVKLATMLDKKSMEIELDDVSESDWVKINTGTVGFYRTRYSSEMLNQLIPATRNQTLSPLDRLGLLNDLFALVQVGRTPTSDFLKFIGSYRSETNYSVWISITDSLCKLKILLSHTDLAENFNRFNIHLYKPIADTLTWDPKPGESQLNISLRSLVLNHLVSCNCSEVLQESRKRFGLDRSGKKLLPPYIRNVCYKAMMQVADETTFENMLQSYRATDSSDERDRIHRLLGAIDDRNILKKVVDFAMSEDVRSQDSVSVLVSVSMNPKGRYLVWEFFKSNWKVLIERYQGDFLLTQLIKSLTKFFATEAMAIEIETFFGEHETPGTERTVSQSIESIRLNATWLTRDLDSIRSLLNESGH